MDVLNPNYLNYMEQIQKNRKDIEKLYDQELSDITQLNFKENEENGLQYANGKAIFQGKSTIIRDVNTENIEVNSKVELKISSGDADIVIGAGVDNSTLEIHLDNETKNNISRALKTPLSAPIEDEFVVVDTNNAQKMIESSKIEKTENKTDSLLTINNTLYPSMTALSDANKGNIRYGFSGQSEDDLLNWVKNDAPAGYYHFYWSHGQSNGVEVMKASSEYANVKLTFYFDPSMKINILTAGVWSGWKTVSTT